MSAPSYFQTNLVASNVQVNEAEPKIDAESGPPVYYPIGTQGTDVEHFIDMFRQGKRNEITFPKEVGTLKARVNSYWVNNGKIDFNADGKSDRLLLRTVNIPKGDFKSLSTAWLVAITDANGDGKISADEEKAGMVIASGMMAGDSSPITQVEVGDYNNDGMIDVGYTKWDSDTGFYNNYKAIGSKTEKVDAQNDRELVLSALAVYDAFIHAVESAYAKRFVVGTFNEADLLENSKAVLIPEVLRPLYSSIKDVRQRCESAKWKESYDNLDKRIGTLSRIFIRAADPALALSTEDLIYNDGVLTNLSNEWDEAFGNLKWDGEKVNYVTYEQKLSSEGNASKRLQKTTEYEELYAPIYEENGTFHQYVLEMNGRAQKYGYRNFAEIRAQQMFGVSLQELEAWIDAEMKATEVDAKEYIEDLKNYAGKDSIGYWEAYVLHNARIKEKSGFTELPTLTQEQAFRALHQFYEDMGYPLDQAPYNTITMDPFYKKGDIKENRNGTAVAATSYHAHFTCNIDSDKPIIIEDFKTLVHELMHDIHYTTAGRYFPGYLSYQNNTYNYVAESLTMATQFLPFEYPDLMKRYFGDVDGFTDEFIESYSKAKRLQNAWEIRRVLVMAKTELQFYTSEKPWKERLGFAREETRKSLFVEPEGTKYGHITARGHPFWKEAQLSYASYGLGNAMVSRIKKATIKEGTLDELRLYGQRIKPIMEQSADADRASIMKIVEDAEKN